VSDYLARISNRRLTVGVLVAALVTSLGAFGIGQLVAGGTPSAPPLKVPAAAMEPLVQLPPTADQSPLVLGTAGVGSVWDQLAQPGASLPPAAPGATAKAASFAVALSPPIRRDEQFGIVPYWALPREASIDLTGLTTVVYAGLDVLPDGSIQTSGAAWSGFLSQDFMTLIGAAHDAGARVVLSVSDFDQSSLDQLAANPAAPSKLAESLLLLIKMRDLDGVNLDFEGQGSQDRTGVNNLVSAVYSTLKTANAHYQVTLDTPSSAGGTSGGVDDLAALEGSVDAFLVSADQFNLAAVPSATSEMTSTGLSLQATLNEYLSEVPADKVVAVLPLFGLSWPSSDSTLQAKPTGAPDVVTGDAVLAKGRPLWDAITQTPWTPYREGKHQRELFFESPRSLHLASQMAESNGIAGIGLWGLGTDGTNDASFVSALGTPSSNASGTTSTPSSTSSTTTTTTTQPPATSSTTTTTTPPASSPAASSGSSSPAFSGDWLDSTTTVIPTAVPSGTQTLIGVMSSFKTSYPGLTCLDQEQYLDVYSITGHPQEFWVITRAPGDCVNAAFVFYDPTSPIPAPG